MGPEFSLAHLTVLGTTPLELIDIAAAAGYDYASIRATPVAPGERVTPLAGDPSMVRQVVHRLADTGVRVLDVELARIGPDEEPDRYVEVLEAAAEVGARHVIGQLPDPDRSRATDRFGRLCDLAHDYGLTVDLEFPSWSDTGDLAAAAAVVRGVDRANAGILIDALHFFRSHSSLDELAALPATWFHFVQLCDAPATVPSSVDGVIHVARSARSLPGYGGLPLPDLLDLLPAGPYSLEVPNDVLRRELGTAGFARLVLTLARAIVASHGQPAVAR
ncbi:MAG TPA: TIM barrel protein [Acidimicrobiales bacterium]|nr:TIM barrel protein [Acidimicrobiales bacterium]